MIERIWQDLMRSSGLPVVKDITDSTDLRTAFVSVLWGCWGLSESSSSLLEMHHLHRMRAELEAILSKWAAKLALLKIPPQLKAELLELAGDTFARLPRMREPADLPSIVRLVDIRSDHDGSRQRTAFMRVASTWFHQTTGQWHDDWVADLTNVAFPDYETTIDVVRSARRGIRP
jgi:hypothetical protein